MGKTSTLVVYKLVGGHSPLYGSNESTGTLSTAVFRKFKPEL